MGTTTIRVPSETRDRLNELARRRGAPAGEIVAELVQAADDQSLLNDAEQSWRRIADDAAVFAAYRDDTRELESFSPPLPSD